MNSRPNNIYRAPSRAYPLFGDWSWKPPLEARAAIARGTAKLAAHRAAHRRRERRRRAGRAA